jgi:hypothetical protein
MAQKNGTVRAEIAGHGQYETTAHALDDLIHGYWDVPIEKLFQQIKERHGDPYYDTTGLARIEAILILAELDGMATN